MSTELTITITGEAGQGLQTIGLALCRIFQKKGYYIFADQDYMSRVRGGNNFFRIRVSQERISAPRRFCDIAVCLDKDSVDLQLPFMAEHGVMILDKKTFKIAENQARFFDVALAELAQQTGGSSIYVNSIASGLIAGLMQLDLSLVESVLSSAFGKKGKDVVQKNLAAAREGYALGSKKQEDGRFQLEPAGAQGNWLLDGSQALGLGAIKAGCTFYSAYPMTPSTGIMNYLAAYADQYGVVVEQAEDEIAAVNMAIGAAFAGVRAMTGTSGGGFCLMTEGISLAAMTETPVVIVDAQRPGPATGFPTRTEQADLDLVIHAGHGEFARAVFAPGNSEQLFMLTQRAFNLAEKYQIPVILLTDQLLADTIVNSDPFPLGGMKIERHLETSGVHEKDGEPYQRYQLEASGISPRRLPALGAGLVYADSDEHTEAGHITEDAGLRKRMVEKRFHCKMQGLKKEVEPPGAHCLDGCQWVLMGYGSTYGVMREAAGKFKPGQFGVLHLSQVWPFPQEEITRALQHAGRVITVENNAGAQLAKLLFRETGIKAFTSILEYNGRPFDLDGLLSRINTEVRP
ncbi:2-oxoacid:acceptor oxidoreductase subunit alpha [candidate division FCPU426 bacterium]|nr:2-oxoacid:acceptor oxidoreductase subunit alpha [candidate division FCPU426 bacterium]